MLSNLLNQIAAINTCSLRGEGDSNGRDGGVLGSAQWSWPVEAKTEAEGTFNVTVQVSEVKGDGTVGSTWPDLIETVEIVAAPPPTSPTATLTPVPTATPQPTTTPIQVPTATPTSTPPTPTTPMAEPTATAVPRPHATPTPAPTPVPPATPGPGPTAIPAAQPTPGDADGVSALPAGALAGIIAAVVALMSAAIFFDVRGRRGRFI